MKCVIADTKNTSVTHLGSALDSLKPLNKKYAFTYFLKKIGEDEGSARDQKINTDPTDTSA